MNKKFMLGTSFVLALAVLVVAQTGGLGGNQGNAGLNKNIQPDQTWGFCEILEPISVEYEIHELDERAKTINYSGVFGFDNNCFQGFTGVNGSHIQISYTNDPRESLAESIRNEWQKGLDKDTRKKQPTNNLKGGFSA